MTSRKWRRRVASSLLAGLSLAGCGSPKPPLLPSDLLTGGGAGMAPGTMEVASAVPLYTDRELLKSSAFEAGVADWIADPAESVSAAESNGAAVLEIRAAAGTHASVQQEFPVHVSARAYPLVFEAEVEGAQPGQVALAATFFRGDEEFVAWTENAGGQEGETLRIETRIPAGCVHERVRLSLVCAAGPGGEPVRVRRMSAVADSESGLAACPEENLVWNGSFEMWGKDLPAGWRPVYAEVSPIEGEPSSGARSASLHASPTTSAIEHVVALPECLLGGTLSASVSLKQPASGNAALIVYFVDDIGRRAPVMTRNAGGEAWETLSLTAPIPDDGTVREAVVRIGQRSGGLQSTIIDGVSLRAAPRDGSVQ